MDERSEQQLGRLVRSALDGTPLSEAAAVRLAAARQSAVAHARPDLSLPLRALRWLQAQCGDHPAAWGAGLAFGLAVLVGGAWQWQHVRATDPSLDLQLLADEVPLDVYVSNDFDKWTVVTN
ncbi:DUF3619 family protein [Chitiniphilus purpureus]|uniref:DUF3619 family protein n=1 Tax=Chitiniphilus purpureus TaxID=2981137 RepID=A0ABY6DP22_9NEIS|nr:DUF3619 family protein [Chitiniphilus sp. CD1]UXY16124.1 DUF3619 family protein [Chitiniphilus sp. CD1]